jgi:hypothetical protein
VGRKEYHSIFELVRTNENLEEIRTNILKRVKVLNFKDFMDLYKNPLQSFPHLVSLTTDFHKCLDDFDAFFFRQRVNEGNLALIPELKPSCVCKTILNPDHELAMCPNENCKQFMHISCLRHDADRKCADCKTEFPFKSLVNLKRPRKDDDSAN